MAIKIITIGKKHEDWVQAGVERYQKRLKKPFDVEWVLLPHSAREGDSARQEESRAILSRLDERDMVILLDERGEILNNDTLARQLEGAFTAGRPVVVVIGGAYGVGEAVRARADLVWSLSKLVFPHQLVRLILIEQIYRSQEISRGGGYHHL
jgi:23S rRNA (pseudouridine1915-N3)-methyltransferase